MKNPYEVLGVNPNCSNEELRDAYRKLAKKYHPDNYTDTNLADVAEEKMKEINSAYDEILRIRTGKQTGNSQNTGSYQNTSRDPIYDKIRQAINRRDFRYAEQLLGSVKAENRGAEWYFLRGCVLLQAQYYFDALNYLDKACQMDPNNMEYRNMRDRVRNQTNGYGANQRGTTHAGGCNLCDVCMALYCLDCMCGGFR